MKKPAATAVLPILGISALVTICVEGPVSLASITAGWLTVFLALLIVTLCWWGAYLWLLRRLSGGLRENPSWLLAPLALLSLSLLPGAAVFFSGKLPYVLPFDQGTYLLFRYLAGGIVVTAVLAQEAMLVLAARSLSANSGELVPWWVVRSVVVGATRRVLRLPGAVHRVPSRMAAGLARHVPLLLVLLVGAKLRLDVLNTYHYGDMDVMLSLTYNLLGWPPVTYYHNYMPQTWVYNHLPLFPMMLAPFYWLSENLLHLPTVWAAKVLIGLADGAIAVLLYVQTGGGWRRGWGLVLAAAWMLSPLVVHGDDHPVAVAILFALLALATTKRPWLSGVMLALGVATRNEVAFLALPMLVHFASRRSLAQSVAFFGAFGTVIALVALPFVLFDPAAMDYAMRRQLQRDAAGQLSMLHAALLPYLGGGIGDFLRKNASLMALAFNGLIALLALRDRRVSRVVLLVAVGYLFTLPILLDRYTLFTYAVGLYYAGRYTNPLVAVVVFLAVWPTFPYTVPLQIGLLVVLGLLALLHQGREIVPEPVPSR